MTRKTYSFFALAVLMFCSCGGNKLTDSGLDPARFDTIINNKQVRLYTLKNANGMEVCITNYGGRVVSIMAQAKDGGFCDVCLGYDNIAQYADTVNCASDFGAAIGRFAGRINKGRVTIAGKEYQLPVNSCGHCLNGGPSGWQYQVYDVDENLTNDTTLVMTMHSPDGDNNFPGNVDAIVTYTLTADNTLDVKFEATTDAETVVNMTNQTYFNLSGRPDVENWNMQLSINADAYTPIDSTFMTTGEVRQVYGTLFDFRKSKALATCIADTSGISGEQVKFAHGIDHNFCLNTYKDGRGDDTMVAATLYSPESGIYLKVYTNEPGIQCYTGNFLDGKKAGKHGIVYPRQASVCLGTQKYPDAPNKKDWLQATLKPGEKYYSHVAYHFTTK